jgi:hypothetical protein
MAARRPQDQTHPFHRAREVYLAALGVVLGVALVVGLTDDLGRRVCGGVDMVPGMAILFGCDR